MCYVAFGLLCFKKTEWIIVKKFFINLKVYFSLTFSFVSEYTNEEDLFIKMDLGDELELGYSKYTSNVFVEQLQKPVLRV
jgi:hypothetical protein